jgi:hypothetical protein
MNISGKSVLPLFGHLGQLMHEVRKNLATLVFLNQGFLKMVAVLGFMEGGRIIRKLTTSHIRVRIGILKVGVTHAHRQTIVDLLLFDHETLDLLHQFGAGILRDFLLFRLLITDAGWLVLALIQI